MKKIYSLFALSLIFVQFLLAGGSACTIDPNNTLFFSPAPDSIPCIERGNPVNQVIQISVPASIDLANFGAPISFVLTVDSVVITAINGLPTGLTYGFNPYNGVFYGGTNGCSLVSGTTNDPVGNYPLNFDGFMSLHGQPFPGIFDGDTTIDLATLAALSQGMFSLAVDVINPGDECRPAPNKINGVNADLNTMIYIYPNPNNGQFEFKLDAARRVKGDIIVSDVAGRKVYSEPLDVTGFYATSINLSGFAKGLYNVQLRTAEGSASRNISID